MGDIYLWRQIFILTTNMLFSISIGNMVTLPSVLIPALLSTNSTQIEATPAQASWIATSNGIAGIIGFFVLPPILQIFGRKVLHMINCLLLLSGWIIFALAHSVTALLAARIIQGVAIGGLYLHAIILSEYCDPIRRGYFVTIKKAATASGILMCHSLSLIWNWRQIATLAIIFPTLSMVLTPFWPESPSYLAMKGRFKESEKSFIWLHGDSNLQELHLLHSLELQKTMNDKTEKWYKFLFKKEFMKPFAIISLLTLILELSGKHYLVVYVIQMMMELVGGKSLAICFTIGADLLTVFSLMFSCFIISCFNRRTVLFSSGVTLVFLMFTICIVVLLKLPTMTWLAPSLIVLSSFLVNISIAPVCYTLIGELLPLEHKGWGSCLSGIVFTSLYTILLEITPIIMESTGVGGVYAIFGVTTIVSLLVLYFIVPETKDKSLAEIENEFRGAELPTCEENRRLHIID